MTLMILENTSVAQWIFNKLLFTYWRQTDNLNSPQLSPLTSEAHIEYKSGNEKQTEITCSIKAYGVKTDWCL